MHYVVSPLIMSQGKCRKFYGFKENVNFVRSSRMETQLGKSFLASFSKSLSVSRSECVMQYTVMCEDTALYK
jgi:hypothetical protein